MKMRRAWRRENDALLRRQRHHAYDNDDDRNHNINMRLDTTHKHEITDSGEWEQQVFC